MTTVMIEHFGVPASGRETRLRASAHERAADLLGGRTVWCAAGAPAGRRAAEELRSDLERSGGVRARMLPVDAVDPLRALAVRLDGMLRGAAAGQPLGAEERAVYAEGAQEADRLLGPQVRDGDVLVVLDALIGVLALAARERGAHVAWRPASAARGSGLPVRRFLQDRRPAVDAELTAWTQPAGRGGVRISVAAFMACPDRLAGRETTRVGRPDAEDTAWADVFADVVRSDRGESVGGRLHARPNVAAR